MLGNLDLSAYLDMTWYAATDTRSGIPETRTTMSFAARYDGWLGLGSLDLAPGISSLLRPSDGAYQLTASVTVLGSFRRGLRDFSSLELDFPEQRSNGVPWRGPNRNSP